MPTYCVYAALEAFNDEQRHDLAQGITEVHARVTGAPSVLVQVVFVAVPHGNRFIGGVVADARSVWVSAGIRAGRSVSVRSEIAQDVRDVFERVAGTPHEHIWVYLSEIPHTDMIEFGEVLPPPGEEVEWLQGMRAMPAALQDRVQALGR